MKISVVIPIYNVEDCLAECLDSMIAQTSKELLDVVLVNDGSTDSSGTIAKSYEEKYPTIFKYVEKTNGGLADARNFGVKHISGDYVMFVDSDDFIPSTIIEHVVNVLETQTIDLLVFNYNRFSGSPTDVKSITDQKTGMLEKHEYLLLPPTACNKVMRANLFIDNNLEFPVGLWYEDKGLTASFVNYVENIYFLDEIGYHYRVREGSITNQESYNSKMEDIFSVMDLLYNQLISTSYTNELEYLFLDTLLAGFPILFLEYGKKDQVRKCVKLLDARFPNWTKNEYYLKRNKQYKILCNLVYKNHLRLAKLVIAAKGARSK